MSTQILIILDYSKTFAHIFTPVGSCWRAPNLIWTTGFARNKPSREYHPSIVERIRSDKYTLQLAPGTSKGYSLGSCVFKTKLRRSFVTSYFLLMLSMPYVIDDLLKLSPGWGGVMGLSYQQLQELKQQIKWCKG